LPIGARDDTAAYVERLRFTFGEGPCLLSSSTGAPVLAAADDIAQRWPELHRDRGDRFRAVACLPSWDGSTRIGALDRYLASPLGMNPDGVIDALAVAERRQPPVHRRRAARRPFSPVGEPLDPLTGRISRGGRAIGMMNVHLQLTAPDAPALLRAHAHAADSLVDGLAHAVVTEGRDAVGSERIRYALCVARGGGAHSVVPAFPCRSFHVGRERMTVTLPVLPAPVGRICEPFGFPDCSPPQKLTARGSSDLWWRWGCTRVRGFRCAEPGQASGIASRVTVRKGRGGGRARGSRSSSTR